MVRGDAGGLIVGLGWGVAKTISMQQLQENPLSFLNQLKVFTYIAAVERLIFLDKLLVHEACLEEAYEGRISPEFET